MAAHTGKTTTNHDTIRRWTERRGGHPACVKGTGSGGDPGMIRLDFPGYSGSASLQPITWDEWFRAFDDNGLALVYQDKTASGKQSNFNKLVSRETIRKRAAGESGASVHHPRGKRKTTTTRRAKTTARGKTASRAKATSRGRTTSRAATASRGRTTARAATTARGKTTARTTTRRRSTGRGATSSRARSRSR